MRDETRNFPPIRAANTRFLEVEVEKSFGSPMAMGDDDVDDLSESISTLPWHWVIEALAGFKEITISTLQGLIDASPVGPDDFSENIRELVAMRCLEELCASSAKGVNLDASSSSSSTLDSRVGFDFSHACVDILQEILHEVPLSNLRMAGAELLKWDVSPFIMHKRAGTVKCHLEQLKESILEGSQPLTDHLKERSGLFQRDRDHTVRVNDGEGDDHPEKDDGNSTYADNMGAKENLVSLILKDGNKSSKECFPDNNLLSSKRNRFHSDDEHYTRHLHEKQVCTNECDDLLRIKKRIKRYASRGFDDSKKEKPASQLGKEVSENSTEKVPLNSEKGGHHTENNNRAILRDGPLEDSHNRCTASNLSQSSSHNEVFHDESNTPCNATLMPQHTLGGENSRQQQVKSIVALPCGTRQKTSGSKPWSKRETDLLLEDSNGSQQTGGGDKAQDDTDNGCGVGISCDTIVYQGEKINLVMKQHEEKNPDMKCNKGGQLLVCEPTTAPLLVPESCLGMATKLYPQHTSGVEPCHDTSMDETNDAVHVEPISTNDGNANKIRHMTNESQPKRKEPNVASLNASQKPVASDKAVVDTVDGCGAELSSDSDGYHNEKIDLVAKKDEFLSSQHTVGRDLSAMTESTKQNFCMKCNEAGQLLVCKTTTCSLMVHKNCLSASGQLDEKGNFFCPFCAYSHTISEYLEAKEKASLARKELAIFINKGIRKQDVGQEFSRQEHSLSRKNYECEHIHLESNINDPLTANEENREDHVGEHANEVNNFHFERSQQQASISVVHSSGREKENVNNGLADHVREEDEGEMLNAMSLTGGRIEDKEVSPDHVGGHDDEKFSCKKANIFPASNAGDEFPQNMTQHNINETVEPVCAHDTKKEEISEDECKKHSIPKYSMRFRKHEIQYKTPPSPQLRRKNIPWTAEEEELIREGVQKFAFSGPKIPWKKILAFGSHLFEKDDRRRTSQDLKDKWKNMCKAHSKLN